MGMHHKTLAAQKLAALPKKQCARCRDWKHRDFFHNSLREFDGLCQYCKPCVSTYNKAGRAAPHRKTQKKAWETNYRKSKKGKEAMRKASRKCRLSNPKQAAAKAKVGWAIKVGKLALQPCERCGRKPEQINGRRIIEAHHPDYSKPLEIIWLCKKHHSDVHKKYRR